AHCEAPKCPATGDLLTCIDGQWLSRCLGGSVVSASDCGAGGCSAEGGAHCSKAPPAGEDPVVDDPALEGGDAGPDAGGDAAAPAAETESSSGCAVAKPGGSGAGALVFVLAAVAARRRRRRGMLSGS
ncbi:MAG: hypothetical protein JNL79_28125, partial [Myxococcales bacterium]|nr:hypothetical protein [Myxococcales bacterium]